METQPPDKFIVKPYNTDFLFTEGKIVFHYSLIHGAETYDFSEEIQVDLKNLNKQKINQNLLKNVLDNLMIFLAMSYWKLFIPRNIIIENNFLTQKQAEFWNTVYSKGMGEFFFRNQIDFREHINIPHNQNMTAQPVNDDRNNRSLLLVGGGKDSNVSAELLKSGNKPFTAFTMNLGLPQKLSIDVMGCDSLMFTKRISPNLLELNKLPDAYNGHVPISIGYAMTALLACVLYDYKYIVASNEISASVGNTEYLGMEINHQWSKSFEFEKMFQQYIHEFISPDITYFSLLREFHEITIVKKFAQYSKYFKAFSSCNKNFRIDTESRPKTMWCNECAKDPFMFLLLSCFLNKEQVIEIMGENLLAKPSLSDTYRDMLGIKGIKPFECVGTPDEVKSAFILVHDRGEFESDVNMKMFVEEVLPTLLDPKALVVEIFARSGENAIPEEFMNLVSGL